MQMYWLGPLLGGILAAVLYDLVFATNARPEKAMSLMTEKDYDDSQFDDKGRRTAEEPRDDEQLKGDSADHPDYGTME